MKIIEVNITCSMIQIIVEITFSKITKVDLAVFKLNIEHFYTIWTLIEKLLKY